MKKSDITVAEIIGSSKENEEDFWGDISRRSLEQAKKIIEKGLEAEVEELVRCEKYGQNETRIDYRNGSYERTIHTKLGLIPIRMPRILNQRFQSNLIRPYQRRVNEIDIAILNCFVFGCSTRNTTKIIEYLSNGGISHQTVSNIIKKLDADVRAYHSRKLNDTFEVIFCDGMWVKKKDLFLEKAVVLYAMGLKRDGTWEVIDFHIAPNEDATSWGGLLSNIRARGIWGNSLQLIVGDEAGGLKSALQTYYPHVQYQACVFHKIQNILKRIKDRRERKRVSNEVKVIWEAPSKQIAAKKYWNFCKKYQKKHANAVKTLQRNFDDTLRFYEVSLADQYRFKTNNVLERYLEEVRRRIIPMRYFKNHNSAERIIYALAMAFNLKQSGGDTSIIKFQHTY